MNADQLKEKLASLEEAIGYSFKDKNLILLALTHSSYANENKQEKLKSNERLEFLGDAVLNVVISECIYRDFADLAEGEMTRIRSDIVCEPSLVRQANRIDLGGYLLLGKGEELTGGRKRPSVLSDAFEALIGAIYMDGGIEKAREFICENMGCLIKEAVEGSLFADYKTRLQELVQKSGHSFVKYEIIEERGPDHSKVFVSHVLVNDKVAGRGEGRNKKEAEQNAARAALKAWKAFDGEKSQS